LKLKIGDSVGRKGTNNGKDVKLIKALLNTYARKKDKTAFTIDIALEANIQSSVGWQPFKGG